MEVMDSLSSPTGLGLSVRSPQRELSQKSPLSPRGPGARDARFKRTSPKLGAGGKETGTTTTAAGKWNGRMRMASSASKPLVPVTERKSQDEKTSARRMRNESDGDKIDITPDGGSAGREGRHFTVSNVGNNGRIYLRPTVRPANQRYPQPNFVFPMTPPGTAGLDVLIQVKPPQDDNSDLHGSQWTPTSTPQAGRQRAFPDLRRPTNHRRAHSDSTVREGTSIARDSDVGAFKIIISKPGEEPRSKTMEDLDMAKMPLLDIQIPSWKLGTLGFNSRGTAVFRGSSYAPTEDFPRSSNVSFLNRSQRGATPQESKRPSPLLIPEIRIPPVELIGLPLGSARLPPPVRSTYLSTHLVIEPAMFDTLTFKPACDDRAIVRYSPGTGAVTAATPPRLVAEITSPSFLDYELISDFFLTYRAFLEPTDLLRMLVARLRWALARDNEVGMVVRVRTFVALRHWILNYFVDDFVVDYNLRVTFCNLLNDFVDEVSQDIRARKVQLKILAELKKCWRRVCAQFWDGPEFDASLGAGVPIAPGGIAGHRNPSLDPSFWATDGGPPQLEGMFSLSDNPDDTGFFADVSKAGHIADSKILGDRPATPEARPFENTNRRQNSPTSVVSVEIVSCSFPGKTLRSAQTASNHPLGAHPVASSSVYSHTGPVATTPRALVGKRVRPSQNHSHKRNPSLTDSLREKEHAAVKSNYKDADLAMSLAYAGSLVRGNLMPPGQPFVEVVPPSVGGESQRQTTVFQPAPVEREKSAASAMSGQGMRKLIGSVRRALSTRGQGVSPTQGAFINISPIGPRGATTNRLPGTAIVPQARPRQHGVRPPVRIDLLGAEIAEDFKKAVREDAAAEAGKQELAYRLPPGMAMHSAIPGELLEYSAAHMDSLLDTMRGDLRPTSDTAITTGSKSIVIVDDTLPFDLPIMAGALPVVNPSVEAFADSFIATGADPTPPNTPPGHNMGTPRRSSYLLNQHVIRPSLSADPLPPFVLTALEAGHDSGPSVETTRPSVDIVAQSPRKPPVTGSMRMHRRHRSSRTNRSLNSMLHRRVASYSSVFAPQSTIRSFDATTYSEGSDADEDDAVPPPLRVLRRRPGGDLRAVINIGDLPLHKSRSVGSLTAYSESLRSSYLVSPDLDSSSFVNVVSSNFSRERAEDTFSLGAMAEQPLKRNLSLFSTHSSKPIMRPSFEAEAQKLAQIPDDVDDDGGVEAALLKLEGKFEKRPFKLSMEPTPEPLPIPSPSPNPEKIGIALGDPEVFREEKRGHRHLHVVPGDDAIIAHQHGHDASSEAHPSYLHAPHRPNTDLGSQLSDNSRASYSSIPLLERGLTDDGRSKTATREWTDLSVLQDGDETPRAADEVRFASQHASYDFVKKTESMERIRSGDTMPSASEQQSFLNDESDDDDGTDLSSELSAEVIGSDDDEDEPDAFPPMRRGASVKRLPPRLLGEFAILPSEDVPHSPPMTLVQALRMSPETAMVPELHEHQLWQRKPLPPTPDTSPTDPYRPESPHDPTGTIEALRGAPKMVDPEISKKFSVHLPFILAFDSEILAQQFTLIEKDALNEIDWKELIDMGWKNATNNNARSWVDFLRNTDAHGVEVVIARFNIMVKWAVSECVLTQDIEERARCIIKYIHIAAHCRRYRNFATMSQIAIALTSQEVSRLTRTWSMVPAHDIKTLRDIEALVSPTRNFYSLRAEMEAGSDTGCIPFVGIYTHDLLFNAQRPSEIASSPTTAPLVNFERCRMAATVIKTLLRLLEASTVYQFQPVEGITERCLWMSALSDEEIRKHSDGLE